MGQVTRIHEHMEVIGADGVTLGTVDRIEGHRIKLVKTHQPGPEGELHHFVPLGLVAEIEGEQVRLSATAANALQFEESE